LARKSLQLGPDLSIAHAQLGRVLTFEGQHEQAIAEFEKAVALNPNFTDWWFGMALQRGRACEGHHGHRDAHAL
jgi:tetratricopeptide (TPR) repeat protein